MIINNKEIAELGVSVNSKMNGTYCAVIFDTTASSLFKKCLKEQQDYKQIAKEIVTICIYFTILTHFLLYILKLHGL